MLALALAKVNRKMGNLMDPFVTGDSDCISDTRQ